MSYADEIFIKNCRDIIENGRSGFLFPKNDMHELVRLVKAVHSGEISIDSNEAHTRYKEYSLNSVFDKTYGVMKELIER